MKVEYLWGGGRTGGYGERFWGVSGARSWVHANHDDLIRYTRLPTRLHGTVYYSRHRSTPSISAILSMYFLTCYRLVLLPKNQYITSVQSKTHLLVRRQIQWQVTIDILLVHLRASFQQRNRRVTYQPDDVSEQPHSHTPVIESAIPGRTYRDPPRWHDAAPSVHHGPSRPGDSCS